GKPELIVGNELDSTVTVYRNQMAVLASCTVTPGTDTVGNVAIGGSRMDSVVVSNSGSAALTISTVTSDSAGFTITPTSGTVGAGGSKKFYVTFTPQAVGTKTGTFHFIHTGTSSPTVLKAVATGYYASDTLVASSGPNGTISPSGTIVVTSSTNKSFTFTPATGYHVDTLLIDGVRNTDSLTGYTFRSISANHTIRVIFSINQYVISALSGPNGVIAPSGAVPVPYGSGQRFVFTPAAGYHVDSVQVDGILNTDSLSAYTFFNVTAVHSIRVTFRINQYPITATAGANGAISPSGTVQVNYGASQRFIFNPSTGFHTDSVVIDGVRNTDSLQGYTFGNVSAGHTIRVTFRNNQYTITASSGPNGTIVPQGIIAVAYDSSQTFLFQPAAGYKVDSLFVDGAYAGAAANYQFQHVQQTHTISVRFAVIQLTITVSAGSHGTVIPGSGSFAYGTSPLFRIVPDSGYYVDSVFVDSLFTGDDTTYQFAPLTVNHAISASFVRDSVTVIVSRNWNLVSLPLKMKDSRREVVFPEAVSAAFSYAGSYTAVDTLQPLVGYWLRFPAAGAVTLTGKFRRTDTIAVQSGWNLVGTIAFPVPASSIVSVPPGLVTSKFFAFTGSYQQVDTLHPGLGYWVKIPSAGQLILNGSAQGGIAGRIRQVDPADRPPSPPEALTAGKGIPASYALASAYPNPFNPSTTIGYALPVESRVTVTVYSVLGDIVARLVSAVQPAGYYQTVWNAGSFSSGIYFYRLEAVGTSGAESFSAVRKILLVK
ncbi:MAG TPA: choice-of-anchor D domain-containing protein, partial [Bacteroidota bacterium]|nr:choice-of-anchor D domain-containing protein [Bacteroidota bacterium]